MKQFFKSTAGTKGLILAACLSAVPQMAFAAAPNESVASVSQKIKIVPTLGYTYFNIQGTSADYKAKGGNSLGVLAQMPMGGAIELEGGLEYLETGAKLSQEFGFLSLDYATVSMKHIAIPLRAKYIFNSESQGTHWYGKAGLTPTILMSAKMDVIGGESVDMKSDMNNIGLLSQAGLGADWGFSEIGGRVSLDVTYSYGLTKVSKNDGGRAAGFQVAAGYAIPL